MALAQRVFKLLSHLLIWGFVASLALVFCFRFLPVPITPLMVFRSVEHHVSGLHYPTHQQWVGQDRISSHLKKAAVVAEDFNFYQHDGFDWEAIQKAREWNKKNKRLKGASTITQQTAKNLFLWPQRSWIRKGLEAYFTVLIEALWPKERILEVYLNIVEFGPGIYGAEAAAQTYFKKPAIKLTPAEAARLIAVLPNPRKFKANSPSSYVLRRQNRIMQRMWGFKVTQLFTKEVVR
ncbi:MAG: monofunctional biosynthetic peptidoglycan transglycosylase [Bdellovibrionia bacterium]